MIKAKVSAKPAKTTVPRKRSGKPLSWGTGRRKKAIARVWMRHGAGAVVVNGKDYRGYFESDIMRGAVQKPFAICPVSNHYDFQVNVHGGGKVGQAQAIRLGIARALLRSDENFRKILRQHELLTVDSRGKERKKYGQRGARRKFQFVKR